MNKQNITAVGVSLMLLAAVAALPALAAGITLTNGGLGQIANNPDSFGVAVCNGGTGVSAKSVPVSITVNGVSVTISSPSSIAVGACGYAYVDYSQFNMMPGQSYSVAVTIDPNHTVIANTNNQASYSVTVPGTSATATGTAKVGVSENVGFLASIGSFFGNFFTALKNLF